MQPDNFTPDWSAARAQMLLDPTVLNLNTGSFGPVSRPVFAFATALRQRLAEEPMDFLLRQGPPLLWQARETLAAFLGSAPGRLIFTANVSAAINLTASSLTLAAPGEILLTDHEYGAMQWCWERAAQRQGLTLRTFPLPIMPRSPQEITDAFCAAFTPRTRLVFFSHVLSPTGLVLPAADICAEARRRNILTVIDGAHAPAMIPLHLDNLDCDFYAGNCHKWLLAPTGTGFLHFRPGNGDRLRPLHVSWGWHMDHARADERNDFGSTQRIYQLEFEGTRDPCAWMSIQQAIEFQEQLGLANIRQRNEGLVQHARQRLGQELGLPLWTPDHPELHGFLTAFRLLAHSRGKELQRRLWEQHRIEVPVIEKPYGWLLRISTHFYNTEEEIDQLAEALQKLAMAPGAGGAVPR